MWNRILGSIFVLIPLTTVASAQWYSFASGDFNNRLNWNSAPDSSGVNPIDDPNWIDGAELVIQSGHTMTTSEDRTIGFLTINAGGVLNAGNAMGFNSLALAGTLVCGSNTLTNIGHWTNTGTFDPGTGTVVFGGTGSRTITTGGTGLGKTFYNVTIDKSTGGVTLGGAITVTNDFGLQSGTFSTDNANDYSVSVAGNITISGGTFSGYESTVTVGKNWTLDGGTFGASVVFFNGSSAQSIGGVSQTTFTNLEINNSSGVTLNQSASVGNLTFTAGNIRAASLSLLMISGDVFGAGAGKCIVTGDPVEGGVVGRSIGFGGSFVFPIGATTTTYDPVGISLSGGPAQTFYARVDTVMDTTAPDAVQRRWNISAEGPGNNLGMHFQWAGEAESGSFDRNSASLWRSGPVSDVTVTGSDPYDAFTNDIFSFQDGSYLIGNTAGLPVQLSNFTAAGGKSGVGLRWRTESEVENYGFEVERRVMENGRWKMEDGNEATNQRQNEITKQRQNASTKQRHSSPFTPPAFRQTAAELRRVNLHPSPTWTTVGFVPGAGTSSSPREYSFVDKPDQPGRYAYRIRQIDHSGASTYTSALEVVIGLAPLEFSLSQNYPNPFNPSTFIEFTIPEDTHVTLKVFDLAGREVATLVNGELAAGVYHQVMFDASRLASGTYVSQLKAGGKIVTKRMVLVK